MVMVMVKKKKKKKVFQGPSTEATSGRRNEGSQRKEAVRWDVTQR